MKEFIGRNTPLVVRKHTKNNSTEYVDKLVDVFKNTVEEIVSKEGLVFEEVKVKDGSLDSESPMIDRALDFARKLDSAKSKEKWVQVIPTKIILD